MENLIFNGVSTLDMGVRIQTPPVYEFPNKIYEKIHIHGKTGDLIIDKQSYQNVQRKYFLALGFRENSNFITNAKMLVEWLLSVNGYAKLEDSYEPDYFRMALFEDPGEIPNYYNKATSLEVSFNCKPQRYLKIGDIFQSFTPAQLNTVDGIKIINPTNFIALPEIILEGSIGTKLEFRSGNIFSSPNNISDLTSNHTTNSFIIDSDLQDCYSTTEYVNNKITLTNGFPKLYPGLNWIKRISGTITKFEIKPRWWTI